MKKTTITVTFDDEKLSAARLYMAQKELSFEEELEKAAETLYGKYVPAGVREFIEMSTSAKSVPKPKKPKTSSCSAMSTSLNPDAERQKE